MAERKHGYMRANISAVVRNHRLINKRGRVKLMVALVSAVLFFVAYTGTAAADRDFSSTGIRIMTQNLYVGANIFRPASAQDLEDFYRLLDETFTVLNSTNIYERAQAVAREVAHHRPHLIGLQEVYQIQRQDPSQSLELDYLEILEEALEDQGLEYRTVGWVENLNLTIPILVEGSTVGFVRLNDRDVILARGDVDTSDVISDNYAAKLQVPLPFGTIEVPRGFVAVHATIGGKTFFFVNTHLEQKAEDIDPSMPEISIYQTLQAQDLLGRIASEPGPVIVVGDFNSDPRDPITASPTLPMPIVPPYQQFISNGYIDLWSKNLLRFLNPSGFTCCQDEDLLNEVSALDQRVDLIFVRNQNDSMPFSIVGVVLAVVVGDEPRDMTNSGLWPSDHGGVAAKLFIPDLEELDWTISSHHKRGRGLRKALGKHNWPQTTNQQR